MKEKEWINNEVIHRLQSEFQKIDKRLQAQSSVKLPYVYEIREYADEDVQDYQLSFETDICIFEINEGKWKPRVVIEGKVKSITTHDAITYSHKAQIHKSVHPYLRYGILLGKRDHYPLPGRLYRHGAHFDFMLSWQDYNPNKEEWGNFLEIIMQEIEASHTLEEMLYNSRSPKRRHFVTLHRPLILK